MNEDVSSCEFHFSLCFAFSSFVFLPVPFRKALCSFSNPVKVNFFKTERHLFIDLVIVNFEEPVSLYDTWY